MRTAGSVRRRAGGVRAAARAGALAAVVVGVLATSAGAGQPPTTTPTPPVDPGSTVAATTIPEPATTTTVNGTVPPSTATVEVRPNIPYLDGGPTYDAYLPTGDPSAGGPSGRPALVLVHGGCWACGSKTEMAPFALRIAEQEGWAAFAVDYVLDTADPTAWPDELHDVQAAVRHVAANADAYGVDPERIGLLGGSAGANLVALVSTYGTAEVVDGRPVGTDPERAVPIRAVALWSPPVELAPLVPAPGKPPPGCPTGDDACAYAWSGNGVEDYLGCAPESCPQTYAEASPIRVAGAGTAPTYIANSSDELVPLDQVEAYAAELESAGVPVELDVVEGSFHSIEYGGAVLEPTVGFLGRYLDGDGTGGGGADGSTDLPSALLVAAGAVVVALAGTVAAVLVLRRRRA